MDNDGILQMEKSEKAFQEAVKWLPGGVNSPVRAFLAVGGNPIYIRQGSGPHIESLDGHSYIDYLLSWGPLLFGHAHPRIKAAVTEALEKGTSFGLPTIAETVMAQKVNQLMPAVEVVRMVNSGTEATMSALRLARAFTKRNIIVKFEGCYHGHSDALLVKAGSGVATLGLPDSPGVPEGIAHYTATVPYNQVEALQELFAQMGEQIAAVIVEPVAGNMGCILPQPGYLEELRRLTEKYGTLLIFDEVMTGFRVAAGGGQERFGIRPDLVTLGKVIGGGLPVGAYGGRRDIMEWVAPNGPVYQAGTLSGNPLAMAAGIAALTMIEEEAPNGLYSKMEQYGQQIVSVFLQACQDKGIPAYGHAIGGMFGLFFNEGAVVDYQSAAQSDKKMFAQFFHALLKRGVLLPPSQLESCFLSAVHGQEELSRTCEAVDSAIRSF
ncbi:glutamate-1-semialdehyde 2,1-aminomutase [Alicyclobacillus tengchongensis]|uniref:Glutamate-1-semialdehyde 2,1-aminomutase n=2 Tax=Alicyclobacillus tolerans TaxID=90970 RepID=A0ABT9LX22_9BACL|nr:glutamate-1-semialdehyde 2,1-aminomutase [Alicyclobacillus tengchongensis]